MRVRVRARMRVRVGVRLRVRVRVRVRVGVGARVHFTIVPRSPRTSTAVTSGATPDIARCD